MFVRYNFSTDTHKYVQKEGRKKEMKANLEVSAG